MKSCISVITCINILVIMTSIIRFISYSRYFEFPVDEMLPELVYVVTHSLATLRRILDWPQYISITY